MGNLLCYRNYFLYFIQKLKQNLNFKINITGPLVKYSTLSLIAHRSKKKLQNTLKIILLT